MPSTMAGQFKEDDEEHYYTHLNLDTLMSEAFKDGEDYTLPSAVEELMLNQQDDYLEGSVNRRGNKASSTKKAHIHRLQRKARRFTVDPVYLEMIQTFKLKGNSLFTSKEYKKAIEHYDMALELFPVPIGPIPTRQLEEQVNILSNKVECLLRLEQYKEAQMTASEAILLDSEHIKSLLRRAKATFFGRHVDIHGFDCFASTQAIDDLDVIISLKGLGKKDAKTLKLEIQKTTQIQEENHTPAIHDAVDINSKNHVQQLVEFSTGVINKWKSKLKKSQLTGIEKTFCSKAFLDPMINYPYMGQQCTEEDFAPLQSVYNSVLVSCFNFDENIANAILNGPFKQGGMDIQCAMWGDMVSHQVEMFLYHIQKNDAAGKKLKSLINLCQLEIGSGTQMFKLPYEKWGFLATPSFVTHIWQNSSKIGETININ